MFIHSMRQRTQRFTQYLRLNAALSRVFPFGRKLGK